MSFISLQEVTPNNRSYRIAGIYHESFNFTNFANCTAFVKIKASIYFCISNISATG